MKGGKYVELTRVGWKTRLHLQRRLSSIEAGRRIPVLTFISYTLLARKIWNAARISRLRVPTQRAHTGKRKILGVASVRSDYNPERFNRLQFFPVRYIDATTAPQPVQWPESERDTSSNYPSSNEQQIELCLYVFDLALRGASSRNRFSVLVVEQFICRFDLLITSSAVFGSLEYWNWLASGTRIMCFIY